jgi:hypothetical protein
LGNTATIDVFSERINRFSDRFTIAEYVSPGTVRVGLRSPHLVEHDDGVVGEAEDGEERHHRRGRDLEAGDRIPPVMMMSWTTAISAAAAMRNSKRNVR